MSMGAAPAPTLRVPRPRPVFAMFSRLTLLVTVPAAFLGSPSLFYALGINYAGAGGIPLEKIHIATGLALVAMVLCVLPVGRMPFSRLSPAAFFGVLGLIAFSSAFLLLLDRPVSGLVVTFLTPALLLYLVAEAPPGLLAILRQMVMVVLLANSLVGIAEFTLDIGLLPHVAGANPIRDDGRALGIVGQPLTAAFLAGIALLHFVVSGAMSGLRLPTLVAIGIHGAALLVFGGRVALLAALSLIVIFVLFDRAALSRRPTRQRVVLRGLLFLGLIAGALLALSSGLAAQLLARFADDSGSSSTRWVALTLVSQLPPDALIFGLAPSRRADLLAALDSADVIEITWIGWLVDYGLVITLALGAALVLILRACLVGGSRVHVYMVAYFLICISGAQGLGAKSMLLAWMVILLLTLRPGHRSAPHNAASSAPRPAPGRRAPGGSASARPPQDAAAPRPVPPHPRSGPRSR